MNVQEKYGAFKDCSKAPIHQWFQYPAGFSYRLIEIKAKEYDLDENSKVLDPFIGCGTTSVVLKQKGINSVGIEAHPFMLWVAQVKTFWAYNFAILEEAFELLGEKLSAKQSREIKTPELPALLNKCFSERNLIQLLSIKSVINELKADAHIKDFFNLALASTLRLATKAGAGWPYIAPTEYHRKKEQDSLRVFSKQCRSMYADLLSVTSLLPQKRPLCKLILGDSRESSSYPNMDFDLVITSPPYLNNYDYADRTRLEMYFFNQAKSWRDITDKVRRKLMMCATTQVTRSNFKDRPLVSGEIKKTSPKIYSELEEKVNQLSKVRTRRGGKKDYDIMVAQYFIDMLRVLKQVYRVLKKGHDFILVLGDSAPYGVYIPTEQYLGELALGVGFSKWSIEVLRQRGEKWKENPQRHKTKLKESILTVTK